jgi:putative aldouronate transport system substrate-binding protein
LYKLLVTYGAQEKNVSWDQANHSYRNAAFRLGEAATGLDEILSYIKKPEVSRVPEMARLGAFNEAMKYYVSKNYYDPYKVPEEMIVPPLVYDQKTAAEVGDLEAAILSHVDESMARFITGDLSLDKDWDSYVSQIDKMGLKRLIELRQKAYDTKYRAK